MRCVDHVQPDYCPQVCREKDQIVIIVIINFAFNHSNMAEPQKASKFGACLKHAMAKWRNKMNPHLLEQVPQTDPNLSLNQ